MWNNLTTYGNNIGDTLLTGAASQGAAYLTSYLNHIDRSGLVRCTTPARYSGNILVYEARRTAVQLANKLVNDAINYGYSALREAQWKQRSASLKKVQAAHKKLIKDGEKVDDEQGLGYIYDSTGQKRYTATDKYNNIVKDALILSIPGQTIITKTTSSPSGLPIENTTTFDLFIFADLCPKINMDSCKNLILTKVQGRDRTRKELVSIDDMHFSVSGKIVSDYPDIYPTIEVQRLVKIMNYKGMVAVNQRIFKNNGVKSVIIKNFKLHHSEYANEQCYSFDCVAIEEEETTTNIDTISSINAELVSNSETGLLKILRDKKAQAILNTTTNATSGFVKDSIGGLINKI